MKHVVGVRLRNTGDSGYYEPNDQIFHVGDKVIIEGAEGHALGEISVPLIAVDEERFTPIKPILRMATPEDIDKYQTNLKDEAEAYKICLKRISERELPMKLIKAEYTLDRNKLLFYFTADGRVDFRELVKDLAAIFHTRIELRQIGSRDETKYLGGIGVCGREFCCKKFLKEFDPISVKMAKEQKLSLNPTKISGVCGRLMCCLKNEEETYEYLNQQLPNKGELVTTLDGREGTVSSVSILKQRVSVLFEENDEKEILEFPVEELTCHGKLKARTKKISNNHKEATDEQPVSIETEKKEDIKEHKNKKKKGYFHRDKKRKKETTDATE